MGMDLSMFVDERFMVRTEEVKFERQGHYNSGLVAHSKEIIYASIIQMSSFCPYRVS